MAYQIFARKYRPQSFAEVLGQTAIITTLKNAITQDRLHQAYLFCGARGVGKTSIARIFAKSINCETGPTITPCQTCSACVGITQSNSLDVREIDGASHTGVDDVRELREQAKYLPASRKKLYIIDEVHMLSQSAFNALLKILEEPPAHLLFIFATTEPHKIPITILSRCQRFDCRRFTLPDLIGHLKKVLSEEGLAMPDASLPIIAQAADGSVRDALSLLDQVISFCGDGATPERVREMLGLTDRVVLQGVMSGILEKQSEYLLTRIGELYESGFDLKIFAESLLEMVRHIIVIREGGSKGLEVAPDELKALESYAPRLDTLQWIMLFQILAKGTEELARSEFPRFVLETTLIKLLHLSELESISSLIARAGSGVAVPVPAPAHAAKPLPKEKSEPPKGEPPKGEPPKGEPPRVAQSNAWRAFVDKVLHVKPQLGSLLDHAHPVTISNQEMLIGFESGSIYKEMLKERMASIEEIAQNHFGHPFKIEISDDVIKSGAQKTTNVLRAEEESLKDQTMRDRALADPVVKQAQEILGARVKEVRRLS